MSAAKPHKANSGVLYPKKKEWTEAKAGRPTHEGEVSIACPCCNVTSRKRIAGWRKTNDFGPLMTLAFSDPKAPGVKP